MSYSSLLFVKALHVCFVVFWMAGMLYLPRLFVYHTQTIADSESYNMLLTMERKLLRIIMLPAMVVVFGTGLILFKFYGGFAGPIFLHIKLSLALVMAGFHGFFARCYKGFAKKQNRYSKKFYLIINEAPGIIAVIMIFVVIFK